MDRAEREHAARVELWPRLETLPAKMPAPGGDPGGPPEVRKPAAVTLAEHHKRLADRVNTGEITADEALFLFKCHEKDEQRNSDM